MKKLILIACALALPLGGCATGVPTSPGTIANQTKLDEQAAVTANLAYKSWRIAVETGVNSGLIKGNVATKVAGIDNQIYAALQAVDAAYATGNATDYGAAIGNFNTALTVGYTAIGGK